MSVRVVEIDLQEKAEVERQPKGKERITRTGNYEKKTLRISDQE